MFIVVHCWSKWLYNSEGQIDCEQLLCDHRMVEGRMRKLSPNLHGLCFGFLFPHAQGKWHHKQSMALSSPLPLPLTCQNGQQPWTKGMICPLWAVSNTRREQDCLRYVLPHFPSGAVQLHSTTYTGWEPQMHDLSLCILSGRCTALSLSEHLRKGVDLLFTEKMHRHFITSLGLLRVRPLTYSGYCLDLACLFWKGSGSVVRLLLLFHMLLFFHFLVFLKSLCFSC